MKRFKIDKCNPVDTPVAHGTKSSKEVKGSTFYPKLYKRLVGSLMYPTSTQPHIMYAVSLIYRFMESPNYSHWKVGKRILRYIKGTINFGILYNTVDDCRLIGYTDSN